MLQRERKKQRELEKCKGNVLCVYDDHRKHLKSIVKILLQKRWKQEKKTKKIKIEKGINNLILKKKERKGMHIILYTLWPVENNEFIPL